MEASQRFLYRRDNKNHLTLAINNIIIDIIIIIIIIINSSSVNIGSIKY